QPETYFVNIGEPPKPNTETMNSSAQAASDDLLLQPADNTDNILAAISADYEKDLALIAAGNMEKDALQLALPPIALPKIEEVPELAFENALSTMVLDDAAYTSA